ncbi:MAG: enoyl-CoA hydratase/isomerase family protein, partial [Deltaproteobacteria bacterium]
MIAGCTGALRGGVLYLTLDTRGSSVNVFTPAVALELERELEAGLEAGLAAGARAVVLQSAKPGSFVNGVGLLLAASSHAQGAAMERAHTLRRCYERLAAAPVPTIAAIEGNCYGCGLELALACDYRIARDSYDTHFYMPELRDYAFIPLFGATQRLPRLLGLHAAMEVLLGERLDARCAARIGLIDRLAPAQGVAGTLRSLLSTLRARRWPKRPAGRHAGSGAPAIDALPGPERRLARECLRLARLPFARDYRLEDGLREELASFWSSLGTEESERAMSFFFVRQAAKAHGIGSAAYQRPPRLAIAGARRLDLHAGRAAHRGGLRRLSPARRRRCDRARSRGAATALAAWSGPLPGPRAGRIPTDRDQRARAIRQRAPPRRVRERHRIPPGARLAARLRLSPSRGPWATGASGRVEGDRGAAVRRSGAGMHPRAGRGRADASLASGPPRGHPLRVSRRLRRTATLRGVRDLGGREGCRARSRAPRLILRSAAASH